MFIFLDRLQNYFVYVEHIVQIMPISLLCCNDLCGERRPKVVVLCGIFIAVAETPVHAQRNARPTKWFLYWDWSELHPITITNILLDNFGQTKFIDKGVNKSMEKNR